MVSNILKIFVSALIVVRRFFLLIFYPYKTMRKISFEKDYYQVFIIFFVSFLYFKFAYFLRDEPFPATIIFLAFCVNFLLTSLFFYGLGKIFDRTAQFSSFIFTLSYSLIPTLLWFLCTSFLYVLLPPPRTFSLRGELFSVVFITISISLLAWKLILIYLALRFSSKQNFYRIIFMMVLYLVWFIPYSLLLYYLRLFRIPFI